MYPDYVLFRLSKEARVKLARVRDYMLYDRLVSPYQAFRITEARAKLGV
jgi:hypothetical protein